MLARLPPSLQAGTTPFAHAMTNKHMEVLSALLERAEVDIQHVDEARPARAFTCTLPRWPLWAPRLWTCWGAYTQCTCSAWAHAEWEGSLCLR